jgi:hypothetical protein
VFVELFEERTRRPRWSTNLRPPPPPIAPARDFRATVERWLEGILTAPARRDGNGECRKRQRGRKVSTDTRQNVAKAGIDPTQICVLAQTINRASARRSSHARRCYDDASTVDELLSR